MRRRQASKRARQSPITATMLHGTPVDALTEHVAATGADLVIMTAHGHSGFARLRLGRVSDALIRRLSVPVLVLPPGNADAPAHTSPPYLHVLVPADAVVLAKATLQQAIALDAARTSIYTLLTVVQPLPPLDPFPDVARWVNPEGVSSEQHATLADDLAAAHRQLDRTAGPLRHAGVSVDVVALVHPDPATAILEYAAGHAVDLIALATHGRSRLASAMVGSVARAVLHGSPVPVLACRPHSSRN